MKVTLDVAKEQFPNADEIREVPGSLGMVDGLAQSLKKRSGIVLADAFDVQWFYIKPRFGAAEFQVAFCPKGAAPAFWSDPNLWIAHVSHADQDQPDPNWDADKIHAEQDYRALCTELAKIA